MNTIIKKRRYRGNFHKGSVLHMNKTNTDKVRGSLC